MTTVYIEWIGGVAAILTTSSFLPQVYKTWKTKSTESLSLPMVIMFFIGVCLWVAYGLLISSVPILASNVVTTICAALLLYFKLKYR